jgi:hypothetical protein
MMTRRSQHRSSVPAKPPERRDPAQKIATRRQRADLASDPENIRHWSQRSPQLGAGNEHFGFAGPSADQDQATKNGHSGPLRPAYKACTLLTEE